VVRVLLAWELGEGYGHLAPLRALAVLLKAEGHEPAFAVKLLTNAAEFVGYDLGPVWQAPITDRAVSNPVKVQVSYASLLHNTGFGDPVGLAARIAGWRTILLGHRAELLVCEHAPTAAVAARTLGLPVCNVGTGFVVPPLVTPFPSFRVDAQIPETTLRQNEAHVLGDLNRALEILGLHPFDRLQEIFAGARAAVLSYRELDHYGLDRPEPRLGLPELSDGMAPVWPAGAGPRVFAYLRPVPQLTPLLEALRDCRARVLLRASALSPAALAPYLRPGFEVVGESLSFVQAAEECDVFLNYAPHSTVAECLVAGKPGVVMPDNQERILVATRMVQLGAGIALAGDGSADVGAALQQVLDDPSYRRAAERFSASVRHLDRSRIFPTILEDALAAIA
jgi:hypothetical protein